LSDVQQPPIDEYTKRVEIRLDEEGKELEEECRSDGGAVGEDLLTEHREFTGADVISIHPRPKVMGASNLESSAYLHHTTSKYLARRA
jgi:hypothetical protein